MGAISNNDESIRVRLSQYLKSHDENGRDTAITWAFNDLIAAITFIEMKVGCEKATRIIEELGPLIRH